jgi:hypothetical protein
MNDMATIPSDEIVARASGDDAPVTRQCGKFYIRSTTVYFHSHHNTLRTHE